MNINANLQQILKEHDKFFTNPRRIIFEELANLNHPTAEELFIAIRNRPAKISLATIYRNLQTMEEVGLIDKLNFKTTAETRYEIRKELHYHVVCTHCGAIAEMGSFRSVSIEPTAEKLTGYKAQGHDVTVYGLCPNCHRTVPATENSAEVPPEPRENPPNMI